MAARGWRPRDVARLMSERGRVTSEKYIKHLLARRKRPSFGFADDLSVLFGRAVTPDALLRFATKENGRSVTEDPNRKRNRKRKREAA